MRKTIYSKYDKSLIPDLPRVKFDGRIIPIISAAEAEKAVNYLLSCPILGVDTETKPTFHRGERHAVCLLQVSTIDTCFLFRLHLTGITPAIKRLLEDTTVPKIGLSWHDDIRSLKARAEFTPGLFIDLQDMVKDLGIEDLSLQKLYANIFGQKISKRQRLSNWEADSLSESQKQYAAIDAWSCIKLYEEMIRLRDSKDYKLIVVKDPVQPAAPKADKADKTNKETKKAKGGSDGKTDRPRRPRKARKPRPQKAAEAGETAQSAKTEKKETTANGAAPAKTAKTARPKRKAKTAKAENAAQSADAPKVAAKAAVAPKAEKTAQTEKIAQQAPAAENH